MGERKNVKAERSLFRECFGNAVLFLKIFFCPPVGDLDFQYYLAEISGLYSCAAVHVAYLCLVGNTCVYFFERENIWQANARLGDDCCRSVFVGCVK